MAWWYVYMVRCSDDTLYTGITTDVERRVAEHNGEPTHRHSNIHVHCVL